MHYNETEQQKQTAFVTVRTDGRHIHYGHTACHQHELVRRKLLPIVIHNSIEKWECASYFHAAGYMHARPSAQIWTVRNPKLASSKLDHLPEH